MDNDFLLKIVHNNYADEEVKAAFAKLTSKDLVKRFDYLVKSLEVTAATAKLSKRLISKIDKEDLTGKLIDFIEYQKSDDLDIREVTTFLAHNKIDEQELIDNFETLVDYQNSDDKDVRLLTANLALLIDPAKLKNKVKFLEKNSVSKVAKVRQLSVRLLKNIKTPPRPEKTQEIVEMILS